MWLSIQIVEFYPYSMVENQMWVTLQTVSLNIQQLSFFSPFHWNTVFTF